MKKTILKSSVFVAILSLFLVSCKGSSETVYNDMFNNVETEQYDILQLAQMDDNLSTFVELVNQSGLDMSVEFADKPITVFIPTNEAFGNLDKDRYEELTDPQNRVELRRVLMRHILPSEVSSMQFNDSQIIETAVEEEITVSSDMAGNVVTIGGARIMKSDVEAANGMIHVVDAVIEPTAEVLP